MSAIDLELLLFSVNGEKVKQAVAAGVDGIIVDWENQGKKLRQENFDTQINFDTYEDLVHVRKLVPAGQLICRINGFSPDRTPEEIDLAIQGGADEIFLPMVTSAQEVGWVIDFVDKRAAVSILVETTFALVCLPELARLPIKRAYVGLNDLHIQQKSQNIFVPLIDGTVAMVRSHFTAPVGAGGVTHPDHGQPISSKYLINEYARIGLNFSFLRRSFLKDSQNIPMCEIFRNIKSAYAQASQRSIHQIDRDFTLLQKNVTAWSTNQIEV